MDETVKFRLVGGIVIVSILAIILPLLADESPRPSLAGVSRQAKIPNAPQRPNISFRDSITISQDTSTTQINGQWLVQMASFTQASSARRLAKRLTAAGYPCKVIQTLSDHGRDLYRVTVGPEESQQAANQLKLSIQQSMNLVGLVRHFK